MESTWVNTSLGLNLIPNFQQHDADDPHQADPKKKEFEEGANFAKFEGNHVSDVKQEQAVGGGHVLLAEELSRISFENKKLAETLAGLCENYNTLQAHFKELMVSKQHSVDSSTYHHQNESSPNSKKRKAADHQDYNNININGFISGNTNETSCCTSAEEDPYSYKRPKDQNHINLKISRVYVRIDASDTRLIVKDGYQWRKYGQKVTRDNPSPRAYFKCSFAPTCPVKKKVQKSAENPSVLVATYEGEHNHMHPAARSGEVTLIGSPTPFQAPNLIGSNSLLSSDNLASNRSLSSSPSVNHNMMCAHQEIEAPDPANFQQFLVQQMASSLTKDPNFTSTLAAAISAGRISINLDHTPMQKW